VAYDTALAQRIRDVLADTADVTEMKMFGGLAFMVRGHMACGVMKDGLIVRLGPEGVAAALQHAHTRQPEMGGRPMTGIVLVEPEGVRGNSLGKWVAKATGYTAELPPKAPKKPGAAARGRSQHS
jgi:hypothetical protein